MKFVVVAENICGDDSTCGVNTLCVRPEFYDSPLFCLPKSFLNHDFQLPSVCNITSAAADITGSVPSVYYGFVILFLVVIICLVGAILYLLFIGHRKYLPSVHYVNDSVLGIHGIIHNLPETVPTLPAAVQNIQEAVRVLPSAVAIASNVDVVAP